MSVEDAFEGTLLRATEAAGARDPGADEAGLLIRDGDAGLPWIAVAVERKPPLSFPGRL